jgi:hypothetical protein
VNPEYRIQAKNLLETYQRKLAALVYFQLIQLITKTTSKTTVTPNKIQGVSIKLSLLEINNAARDKLTDFDKYQRSELLNNSFMCCAPACEEIDGGLDANLLNNCLTDSSYIIRRNRSTSWTSPYLYKLIQLSAMPRNILFSPKIIFSPPPDHKILLTPLHLQTKQEKAKNIRELFLFAKSEKLRIVNERVVIKITVDSSCSRTKEFSSRTS